MLKNKFGMTKILVLVLSVLMLVSLVACNKADGPSTDDMNAAIQAAIDAANAEQAAKEAALAASIAADKAAQEAKDAALAESIAKEKAENDAALKKAQEEAKAAADAAAAASKAAKEAADKAAKDAADAAAKAAKEAADKAAKEASEAAKKAQEAAEKQASELAAALEAAKAEALKAAEEAAKAQAEASKAIEEAAKAAEEAAKAQAEASKAKEEAAVVSSQLAETTVVPETTVVAPAETTVAPETTTEAPAVPVDKTEVLTAFSKLKTEYTYTKMAMFKADDYAELVMLFDKASLDLNNAATVEAATAVLETLKVDVAAIRSVENAAAEVAALVNALGDIETEVFTTQIEKITEAQKAYAAVLKEYKTYFTTQEDKDGNDLTSDEVATLLGINVADLNKAEAKTDVLKAYAEDQLQSKMEDLYKVYNGKISKFDTDDLAKTLTYKNDQNADVNVDIDTTIIDAYYIYRVLAIVNGGDLSDANVPTDWEWLVDKKGEYELDAQGKKQKDPKKPTEWFTTEQLMETFILPTLDFQFDNYLAELLDKFDTGMDKLAKIEYATGKSIERDLDLEDCVDALEADLKAISFVDDYKGNFTMDDAKADANVIVIKAYIEAMNEYLEVAKADAIEAYTEKIENDIEAVEAVIEGYEDQISNTENAAAIERLNSKIDNQEAKIDALNAGLAAYIANVDAATLLTFEEMLNEELNDTKAYKDKWIDITDFDQDDKDAALDPDDDKLESDAKITKFLHLVLANTIKANFVEELEVDLGTASEEELVDLISAIVTDLEALRLRVSPYEDDAAKATIFTALKGDKVTYIEGDDYYYSNTAVFQEVIAIIDAAIANVEAATTEGKDNTKAAVVDGDKKPYFFKDVNAYNYAVANYDYAVETGFDLTDIIAAGLVGITETAYPVEYEITAAEQVSETLIKAYVQAYTDVNAKLVDLPEVKKLATDGKKLITNDGATAFDKIKAQTSGVLADEVQKVANTYTGNIDTARTTFANNISKQKFGGTEYKFEAASFFSNNNKNTTGANVNVYVDRIVGWAAKYNPTGFSAKIATEVDTFEKNFFVTEGDISGTYLTNEAKINYSKSKVVELWNAKLAAVEYITAEIAKYKNAFVPEYVNNAGVNTATGLFTLKANLIGRFNYDGVAGNAYAETEKSTGVADDPSTTDKDESKEIVIVPEAGSVKANVVAKSAEAIAYEAELDALLAKYIDYIMGVEIGDGKTTIYNGAGAKISGFKGDDDSKINYSLSKANAALEAYKKALFGNSSYIVTANNDSQKTVYKYADSEIFKAYNNIILKNTYGVTRPQVKVNITQVDNCTITVGNAYINSEFSITFTPAEGYFVEQYLITAGDGTTLASGYPKDNVKVKVNYANKLNETVNVTAVVKKLVAFEDKTVAIDVDNSTETVVEKKPTVTTPNWYATQNNAKLKVVASDVATDALFGINLKGVTVNFFKYAADGKTLVANGSTGYISVNTAYDFAKGEFAIGTIPADTVKAEVVVDFETAPEFTVTVDADHTANVKLLNKNVVAGEDSNGNDIYVNVPAYQQTVKGAAIKVRVAVRNGYNIIVTPYCGEVQLANGTTPTLVKDEYKDDGYSDAEYYTFNYVLPTNTTKLITLVITSVAAPQ